LTNRFSVPKRQISLAAVNAGITLKLHKALTEMPQNCEKFVMVGAGGIVKNENSNHSDVEMTQVDSTCSEKT